MQRLKIVLTAFCFLLLSSAPALASADGHGESWTNLALRIINLALFVGVIYYFFSKKIVAFFKGRTGGIATEISSLEQRKADAKERLADVERRIANLEHERLDIIAEYTAQGEAMKAAIIEQAEKQAAQICAQAKVTAENEMKAVIQTMRAEMAEKIVDATEQLIAKKLTATEHTRLIDKYLTKVVLN